MVAAASVGLTAAAELVEAATVVPVAVPAVDQAEQEAMVDT